MIIVPWGTISSFSNRFVLLVCFPNHTPTRPHAHTLPRPHTTTLWCSSLTLNKKTWTRGSSHVLGVRSSASYLSSLSDFLHLEKEQSDQIHRKSLLRAVEGHKYQKYFLLNGISEHLQSTVRPPEKSSSRNTAMD